jgi:uncharacterized protein YyaL (SSP411 family)
LFAAREQRVRPGRDDKLIVAWNGLMIDAMAKAGAALGEDRYVDGARRAADFILRNLRRGDGRLLHTWRAGKAKLDAYLDDYASLTDALVSVYEATFDESYIDSATQLIDVILGKFSDPDGGGFFYAASDHERLIARNKELTDSSTPSGNALAATSLMRLGKLLGRGDYLDAAERTLSAAAAVMQRAPLAAGQMLIALDHFLGPAFELVLSGDLTGAAGKQAMFDLHRRFLPRCVIAARDARTQQKSPAAKKLGDLFRGKQLTGELPILYVCQDSACQSPAVGLNAIEAQLDVISSAR